MACGGDVRNEKLQLLKCYSHIGTMIQSYRDGTNTANRLMEEKFSLDDDIITIMDGVNADMKLVNNIFVRI